jgi:hypothetical protein
MTLLLLLYSGGKFQILQGLLYVFQIRGVCAGSGVVLSRSIGYGNEPMDMSFVKISAVLELFMYRYVICRTLFGDYLAERKRCCRRQYRYGARERRLGPINGEGSRKTTRSVSGGRSMAPSPLPGLIFSNNSLNGVTTGPPTPRSKAPSPGVCFQ